MKLLPALMLIGSVALAQSHEETVSKTFDTPGVLYVANVNGSISVAPGASSVEIEVKKKFAARSSTELEQARKNLTLGTMQRGDTLFVFIRGVGDCFCEREDGKWNGRYGYGYRFQDWDVDYDFQFDFQLKVPESTSLIVSTINEGDVEVEGNYVDLKAHNINGDIRVSEVTGTIRASTINGDVDLHFPSIPGEGSFYTLNGDIDAFFKQELNAHLGFKSYNGDLFTNISDLEYLPVKVKKTASGRGVKYKIGEYTELKVRNGGVKLDFETFNGDVTIKEI